VKKNWSARHARKFLHFTGANNSTIFQNVPYPLGFSMSRQSHSARNRSTSHRKSLPSPRQHHPSMSRPPNTGPSASAIGEQGEAREKSQPSSPVQRQEPDSGPTALQLGIALLVLGTSAGFTLYTRKADSMLRRMEQVAENQLKRQRPVFGPPTREYAEKMKPRIDKDEFF
jgi:hypothetical protein